MHCVRSLLGFGISLLVIAPLSANAQAPYIPDVSEARMRDWRLLTASAQKSYSASNSIEGVEQARKALAIAEEIFGVDDPRTLISANDLALHLEVLRRDGEAEAHFRRVFDGYFRTRGEDDPSTQLALENLVDFYLGRKRFEAARSLATYALSSFRRTTGTKSERSRRMENILAGLPEARIAAGGGEFMNEVAERSRFEKAEKGEGDVGGAGAGAPWVGQDDGGPAAVGASLVHAIAPPAGTDVAVKEAADGAAAAVPAAATEMGVRAAEARSPLDEAAAIASEAEARPPGAGDGAEAAEAGGEAVVEANAPAAEAGAPGAKGGAVGNGAPEGSASATADGDIATREDEGTEPPVAPPGGAVSAPLP